jgi:TFIIF-interacting CTD phosphatase-like protein
MSKRGHVILDLDNTLISAEVMLDYPFHEVKMQRRAIQFPVYDMDGFYIVFERPGLQEFLDDLFETYDVSVWTAATKDYALFVIDHILLQKPERSLQSIMFSYHCKLSDTLYGSTKDLRLLWEYFKLPYPPTRTVIVDDLEDVYKAQPERCIPIHAFEILKDESVEDTHLQNVRQQLSEWFQQADDS